MKVLKSVNIFVVTVTYSRKVGKIWHKNDLGGEYLLRPELEKLKIARNE